MTDPLQLEIVKREKLSYGQTRLHIQPTLRAVQVVVDSDAIDIERLTLEKVRYQWGRLVVGPAMYGLHELLSDLHALRVRTEDEAQLQIIEQKVEKIINDLYNMAEGDVLGLLALYNDFKEISE